MADIYAVEPGTPRKVEGVSPDGSGNIDLADPIFSTLTLDPGVGGDFKLLKVDTGATALSTSDATTAITLSIPSGAVLVAAAANVTTAIAGVTSAGVTVNLAFTGGSTLSIGDFVSNGDGNAASNTKITNLFDPNTAGLKTTNTTECAVTISGGVDNTPSAGAVRVVVWYKTLTALDNV